MFTREQIEEIRQKLALSGFKDTELPLADLPLKGNEIIAIVQNGSNKYIPIEEFFESSSENGTKGDLFNVSKYMQTLYKLQKSVPMTLEEAIEVCPDIVKRGGQILTFLDSDTHEWVVWQYQGDNNSDWNIRTNWNMTMASPYIDPVTKHWVVNETDTGISAEGPKGDPVHLAIELDAMGIEGEGEPSATIEEVTPAEEGYDQKFKITVANLRGEQGKSAYEVWEEIEGNEGKTVDDFMAYLARDWKFDLKDYYSSAASTIGDTCNELADGFDASQAESDVVYLMPNAASDPSKTRMYILNDTATAFVYVGDMDIDSSAFVKYVNIDNLLTNPTDSDVASAKAVMQLKSKLEGVTASETKVASIEDWYPDGNSSGYYKNDGTWNTSDTVRSTRINVVGYKSVRFLGYANKATTASYALVKEDGTFCSGFPKSYKDASLPDSNAVLREYKEIVPEDAVYLVCVNLSSLINQSNFYCYLQSGGTVVDMIPKVDSTGLQNPIEDSITKAVDSMEINSNLGKKNLTEVKLENYTVYQGRIILDTSTSPKIGNRSNTNFNYIIVDVEGVTSVRFIGCTLLPADDNSGWAFYNETNYDPESQATNDGGFLIDSTGFINFMQYDRAVDTPKIKEYIVDVPEGAKYMKINSKYFTNGSVIFGSTFYCYLRYGKDIADILNKKLNSDNTLGVFKWKKNLLNPSEFVNGSIETPSVPGSTPVLTNATALLSNKLYLEDNETYTLSNVSIIKSNELYYLMIFEFDENDIYLGFKSYTAEKTSSGTTSYTEIGRRTLVYKKAYSACAYQRIRVRYAVLPTSPNWESWKTAQVEIGNQQTEYAPYHSEVYFPPLTTKTPSEGVNLGNCSYNSVHNLEVGLNVEDNMGTSSKFELIKYDASGSNAVYVSGEYAKGYYTLYPYVWADADGNKIENVTTVYTTKTRDNWSDVRLYVPNGAKYLYLIALGTKSSTYKFEKATDYGGLSLSDYIEDVINSNNEALKDSMKKTVNILAIGNSYSQDSLMYVPLLMQSFDVNVNMTVLMKSSSTLTDAYNSFVNEDPIYIYQYYRAETDDRWHSLGTSNLFTIQKALEYNINYDIILINASWGWGQNTIKTYNKLTSMIANYLDYPVKFACLQVLIHRSATNTHTDPDMPALWDSTKQYAIQDFVLYDGKIYWALASNINKVPTNTTYWDSFYEDWSDTKTYSKNTIVYYNNVLYISNSDANIANEPSTSHFWCTYEWDEYYTYSYLDHCMYNGRVYVSRVETINTGNQPDESPSQWMLYNRPMTVSQFEEHQNSQITSCELVMDNTLCEDIIPVNAAIKNAYTVDAINSIGAYKDNISNTTGFGWLLADDGFHLQEGLPCQLSAYAVCVWLLKKLGMDYKSILGDNTMATAEWLSDKYIQGQQGLPCGYDSTDEENNRRLKFIQKCAVMANKFPYETKDMNVFY